MILPPPNDENFSIVYDIAGKESTSFDSLAPPKTSFGRLPKHSARSALAFKPEKMASRKADKIPVTVENREY